MSVNMQPRILQEFNRCVDELRLIMLPQIAATGQSGSLGTVNNSRIFRVTTSSDSQVRGFTITYNVVESGTPGALSPATTDDVVSA
jgi:hypothetical protein